MLKICNVNVCCCACSLLQINDVIKMGLAMSTLARDMDRWIEKRDDLSRMLEDIRKQKKTALEGEVSEPS